MRHAIRPEHERSPRARLTWHATALLAIVLAALLLFSWVPLRGLSAWAAPPAHGVVLLLPDSSQRTHPVTQAWLEAAREEGIALQTMGSDAFVRAVARGESFAGVMVPDTVHRQASDVWVQTLERYVREGGRLLLTFDAGVFALTTPRFAAPASRLSALAGVRYAHYDELLHETTAMRPVWVSRDAARRLALLPGKLDFDLPAQTAGKAGDWGELTTYGYPHWMVPVFRGHAQQDAQVWMRTPEGDPVLTLRPHGQGQVLFANLPLGYLKTRTDGYLLHRLMGHFVQDLLEWPVLSGVPEGIGGLVLNLHVDSNASQQPMLELEQSGWFRQGPFSIHLTAGPDAFREGDRLGLNMQHNTPMQALLRRLHEQGHEIGNHGGWIHNVFGEQADADNRERFEPWLDLNHHTLWSALGQPPASYSAPMGNHPDWVNDWLQQQGLRAYHSSGNCGLGPTRPYRDGQPPAAGDPWAFPIAPLHRLATFDELPDTAAALAQMNGFIQALIRHASDHGLARLFYFHPASAPVHGASLHAMQQIAAPLLQDGRFRWYAMAPLARFLDRRLAVQWQVQTRPDSDQAQLQAHSPHSMAGMTWVFPRGGARALHVREGAAEIIEDEHQWRVVAGDVRSLRLHWQHTRGTP